MFKLYPSSFQQTHCLSLPRCKTINVSTRFHQNRYFHIGGRVYNHDYNSSRHIQNFIATGHIGPLICEKQLIRVWQIHSTLDMVGVILVYISFLTPVFIIYLLKSPNHGFLWENCCRNVSWLVRHNQNYENFLHFSASPQKPCLLSFAPRVGHGDLLPGGWFLLIFGNNLHIRLVGLYYYTAWYLLSSGNEFHAHLGWMHCWRSGPRFTKKPQHYSYHGSDSKRPHVRTASKG